MLTRCRHGRRVQTYLKISACLFLAICYCSFLYRESLNAFEQNNNNNNKYKTTDTNAISNNNELIVANVLEQRKNSHAAVYNKLTGKIHTTTTIKHEAETTSSTLNPVYDYSEEQHRATERDLRKRNEHLSKVCAKFNVISIPNPWEFFISPGHNLVWCTVFKAASSTWMYYFNILGGYTPKYLQRTQVQPLKLARTRFPRPEPTELMENLASSTSFLFVREPFQRLISGYRDKLEGGRNRYYKPLGLRMALTFRDKAVYTKIHGPTFEEFIKYLIYQQKKGLRFDEHWTPITSFCTPCTVNFTIIGKVETFERDSEFIIRQAGLESLLLGTLPKKKSRKITNQTKSGEQDDEIYAARYFSEINRKTLDQLLEIYRFDFELFDYDYHKYYNYVQPDFDVSSTTNTLNNASIDINNNISSNKTGKIIN